MSSINADDVKIFVVKYLSERAPKGDLDGLQLADTFDFLQAGIIDSMGLLEMISAMEDHFKITVDFEQMDADKFTILEPFCCYVADYAVVDGR
jgi:acyl carrier protein